MNIVSFLVRLGTLGTSYGSYINALIVSSAISPVIHKILFVAVIPASNI